MTAPVPGHQVSTPYGLRGSYWSCFEDRNGNGLHTGVDVAAPHGTTVVAARPGRVAHCNHGAAFGRHQVEVLPGDGTRDFFAHMSWRVADGTQVKAGDKVGEVGAEGNVTGAHLHFERHSVAGGGWSCSIIRDPQPSIDYQEEDMGWSDWTAAERAAMTKAVADAVWDKAMKVTKPDGSSVGKKSGQILRETWSKLSKHIDKGG